MTSWVKTGYTKCSGVGCKNGIVKIIKPVKGEVTCPVCKGKTPYSWTPQVGEICFDKDNFLHIVVGINKRKEYIIEIAGFFEDGIDMDTRIVCPDDVIPILKWETIEGILEKAGFRFSAIRNVDKNLDSVCMCGCIISDDAGHRVSEIAESRQLAVYKAVIGLGKELE